MEAPPSPDYIPGPEAPPSPNYIPMLEAPPLPDYISGPEYPEYLPPADDVLPHLAPTVHALALHSSIPTSEDSDETEPFEEGKTVAT
nr:hypothetical protein [Tanacetum cinerariifolium]